MAIKPKKKDPPITNKADHPSQEISATEPIPLETRLAFSWINDSRFVPFLHPDNDYARLLLRTRLLSVTHNACVTTKKDYCAGSGFEHKDDTELDPAILELFKSMNVKNEPLVEINKQIFESHFTFGNTPIELVRLTVGRKKRFFIYVHNLLEWRLCAPNDDNIITEAIQSRLFLKDGFMMTTADYKTSKKLPLYNPRNSESKNWSKVGNTERTLIWYKNSVSGFPHYGLPSAVSSIMYQTLEYKASRFNLDNIDNNMVVSAILALKGNLSQPEANRIGKQAIKSHVGDGNRGRIMVVASEEGIDGSDFHSFDTHKEGSFKDADDSWTQKIILANQWDSVLAGILSPSSMGKGSGFVTKILEIKQNTVIRPAQEDLMQKVWMTIIPLMATWLGIDIKAEDLKIKNAIDISGLTDVDITPAVKVNEVRKAKGLPEDPTEKGDKYLGELGADQKKGVYVKSTGETVRPSKT